jgi:nicotinate-nucleotide pyrophosphorylase (carboxylating)
MTETYLDIRHEIFREHMGVTVRGALISEGMGVISGIGRARNMMTSLGLRFEASFADGDVVDEGQQIATVIGNPVQVVAAEERIIGTLSKSSGIATAARRIRIEMGSACQVVSGGWKKMPAEIKNLIRQAALDGGIGVRITEEPFVYLDKNYVRILGGVREAVRSALPLKRVVVVQIRGETKRIADEALEAAESGAKIVMVDTGRATDLDEASRALRSSRHRSGVRLAFGGGISQMEIKSLGNMDVDIVDIGYAILDAPCLPMRFDVVGLSLN